ncbi:hypothetical protein GVN24_29580 [Rhizobium sp. CRIBSB]|nr:hypothetical protein [Rhizobium sp. CRIBSB]
MILTCPSCATSYFTPDGAIGPAGRTVRCQSCSNTWRAMPDEPLELTVATEPSVAEPRSFGRREEAPEPESLAETPAAELPGAFRARAEQQRRMRRAATHGAAWAGLASVFVALLGAAWLFRVEVVEMAPRTAAAYAFIGQPVNPTGLEFEAVSARAHPLDPGKVIVSGALRNVRDREVTAPPVRVALLDAHGAEIGHALVRIDAAPVLPGKVQGFAAVIADPGAHGTGVGVDFAIESGKAEAGAHGAPHGVGAAKAHPAPDHAAPDHSTPNHSTPAHSAPAHSAEAAGLRPASPAHAPAGHGAAPVDAQRLDSGHAEAVSPPDHGAH